MAKETEKKTKKTSQGGSKGGTRFPRLTLEEALAYSKKLVSKTFSGPQPEAMILVGVFNNKGPEGGVRASALKQYGLMEGTPKGYFASELAKKIEAVVPDENAALIRQALLTPKLFKQVYDTLQPDKVTRAKVRQAAATGGVHPESLEICVDYFIEGVAHAGLGAKTDEGVDLSQTTSAIPTSPSNLDSELEQQSAQDSDPAASTVVPSDLAPLGSNGGVESTTEGAVRPRVEKPMVTLSLTVDATSDPEKLEKQLRLLRQFGVI
jgi:hypothetical protein